MGTFTGRDIGVNLPILLNAIIAELPSTGSTMLRVGMTNPPYILEHLKEIAEVLRHPCVYSFLHVPVQSGSNAVLTVCSSISCQPQFCYIAVNNSHLISQHIPAADSSYCGSLHCFRL